MKKTFILLSVVAMLSILSFPQPWGGDIYGSVVLEDGSRVAGVKVILYGVTFGKQSTSSSGKGNFRFVGLPPGAYQLRFEREGFKTVVRKGVELNLGKSVTLNVLMETAPLKEEVIVTGEVGMIDTRNAHAAVNVTKEMVASIPTARNPWTVVSIVPGIMIDRLDIGGADSGQQSYLLLGGADQNDNTWNVDSANVTHPNFPGSASSYMNINVYEELQVTLGANDITAQTGGIQLNFVTRRGGNKYSGDFHLYVEDKAWEMHRDPTEYMEQADLVVPGVDRLYMYGINFGGPIVKNRLWWVGSWAVQDIHKRTEANLEDATWLVSGYGKLNFHLGNTTGDFYISYDSKKKWGRTFLSPSQQDVGSLVDQDGPQYIYYGSLSQVLGNLMLNGKVVVLESHVTIDPRGSEVNPGTGHLEGSEFKLINGWARAEGSAWYYRSQYKTTNVSVNGNYFIEDALAGDHEIRFGVDYYDSDTSTESLTPNQRIAYITRPDVSQHILAIAPDTIGSVNFRRISAYIRDTVTFKKFTAALGLRYDKEQAGVNPFTQPYFTWYEPDSPYDGQRMFAQRIPVLEVEGFDIPAAWTMLSPRLALTYDFSGDGQNVLKLSAGRYMTPGGNTMANNYIPDRYGYAAWTDSNGDEIPQYQEVGDLIWDAPFRQLDPATGLNMLSYADDYNTTYLDELTLTFEKALTDDLVVSAAGFLKKRHNLMNDANSRGEIAPVRRGIMSDGSLEKKDNWQQTGTAAIGGTTVPVYQQIDTPIGFHYYNLEKAYDLYKGIRLQLVKKLSNRWMANLSFTFQDWKRHRFEEETLDMNNFYFFNGGQVAPVSSGSGFTDLWINSTWMFKLTGMYQLPWEINLTAFFQAKEGNPQPLRRVMQLSQGQVFLYQDGYKCGDERLPTLWLLNLGLEKTFKVTDSVNATLVIDWYNVTNNQVVQKYNLNIGGDPVDEPQPVMWSQAGLFQFGVRVNF